MTPEIYGTDPETVECVMQERRDRHEWSRGYTFKAEYGHAMDGQTVIVVFCKWCLVTREADPLNWVY
jgi:hypothetical protein